MTDPSASSPLLPIAQHRVSADGATDEVVLDYDARLLRRRRLVSTGGRAFLVDLPRAMDVPPGSAFVLDDGTVIAVQAAIEDLVAVRGALPRLAWHIGNRHAPCQIEADRLLLRRDPVLEDMLRRLGAALEPVRAPFAPEGGAYGHGRTFAHTHAHDTTQDDASGPVAAEGRVRPPRRDGGDPAPGAGAAPRHR